MKTKFNYLKFFEEFKRTKGLNIGNPQKIINNSKVFYIYSDSFENTLMIQDHLKMYDVDTVLNKVNYKDIQVIY